MRCIASELVICHLYVQLSQGTKPGMMLSVTPKDHGLKGRWAMYTHLLQHIDLPYLLSIRRLWENRDTGEKRDNEVNNIAPATKQVSFTILGLPRLTIHVQVHAMI